MTATLAIGDKVQLDWEGHDLHGKEAIITQIGQGSAGVMFNGHDYDRWFDIKRLLPIPIGISNHDRLPEPTTKHLMTLELTDFPFTTVATEGDSEFHVYESTYVPGAPDHHKVIFNNPQAAAAFTSHNPSSEITVGQLIYDHYKLVHKYAQGQRALESLVKGLQRINEMMNDYAEANNLCEEYEETLNEFNNVLSVAGYNGWFTFDGRQEDIAITIERERTIREQAVIYTSRRKGEDIDWYDIQDEAFDANWETTDEEVSVEEAEIIHVDAI